MKNERDLHKEVLSMFHNPEANGFYPALAGLGALLLLLGENPEREGLIDTPLRVLKAFAEMTGGYRDDPVEILSTQFSETVDEVVVLRDINFVSLCEHHLLPFTGVAAVVYLPGEKIVGLSKLARVVQCFARRLQVQERLTNQIAEAVYEHLAAQGVMVIVKATHHCMTCRGVKQSSAEMLTSAVRGVFRTDATARTEAMNLIMRG